VSVDRFIKFKISFVTSVSMGILGGADGGKDGEIVGDQN
jgi:hypothetical protein